jgi:ribosomal protein S18 acetylase RimI-like enzyme
VNVSRPASARPRQDQPAAHDAAVPPSSEELEAIEHDRISWAALLGASVHEQPDLGMTLVVHDRVGSPLNFAAAIRWPLNEVDARLAAVSSRMRAANAWPSVVVCSGLTQPPDLASALSEAGWIEVFSELIMATRRPQVVPHLDPSLRVEAVTPATALEAVRLETAVFGLLPDAIGESAELLARAVADGTTRGYLVRLGREPVATARLVPGPMVCGLHAIGVAAHHRRRGYGRLITSVATRAGLATGHRLVWLGVLEENAPAVGLYRSLGFEPAFSWTRWIAPA